LRPFIARFCAAVAAAFFLWWPGEAPALEGGGALLQGLDKVTARISEFSADIDVPVSFGTLEITVRACHKKPPEEPPESAAFLEIREKRRGEAAVLVFSGWMFASTPGLSSLEHPVYDVWVLDCAMAAENSPSNG
jgi:hypothetical protein